MRFGYCMLPDYPLSDSIEMIKVADELGYYACYSVDETWRKDLWCLFSAAADKTSNIRLEPNVTHLFLPEPTLICRQLATLDELSGERAEAVVSTGNFVMMDQYHLDWTRRRPLSRLREAMHVMRTFLDDGKIDFEGDFFKVQGSVHRAARPVQERLPLKMGEDLDLGAWSVSVVSEDSAAAKRAARILVAFYIPSMPPEQLARHGIDQAEPQPMFDAFAAGDVAKAIEMFSPQQAEKLSVAGTPEECAEQIKRDVVPAGINHIILALADAPLVEFFSGQKIEGVPTITGQLRLAAERMLPAIA
jgi:5,10-methylenetetrahydromethanopterin reductase